jgi:hypothetical protein
MLMRMVGVLCLTLLMAAPVLAEERSSGGSGWRPATAKESPIRTVATDGATIASQITLVSKGEGTLPNDHGQVWREYDISPYSSRVTTTQRPEQAIVDWILRETGTDVWFSEPLGLLNASRNTLRVYHTP